MVGMASPQYSRDTQSRDGVFETKSRQRFTRMEDLDGTRRVRVVMASSREGDRKSIESALSATPWDLVHAWDGREMLQLLQQIPVPIVLYDTGFGNLHWRSALRSMIRTRRRTCAILLADHGSRETSIEPAHVGAFDLLTRPIEEEQLVATLLCAYTQARSGPKMVDAPGASWSSLRIQRMHC